MTAIDRWNAKLAAPAYDPYLAERGQPEDRCGCGHRRDGHSGTGNTALRDDAGRLLGHGPDPYPQACSLMCCPCELFRGETDR